MRTHGVFFMTTTKPLEIVAPVLMLAGHEPPCRSWTSMWCWQQRSCSCQRSLPQSPTDRRWDRTSGDGPGRPVLRVWSPLEEMPVAPGDIGPTL